MISYAGLDAARAEVRTTTTTIRPLRGNVVVEREERETTDGGIVVPETARSPRREWRETSVGRVAALDRDPRFVWARVVSVGPGRPLSNGRRAEPVCSPGDRVVFDDGDGIDFHLDGRDLLLLDEGSVLAVVEQE